MLDWQGREGCWREELWAEAPCAYDRGWLKVYERDWTSRLPPGQGALSERATRFHLQYAVTSRLEVSHATLG
jgi:hypothetical protein